MSVRIIKGDVRDVLKILPDDRFDCICSSPPYYGLRDYGTARWECGDVGCDHKESREFVNPKNTLGYIPGYRNSLPASNAANQMHQHQYRNICAKCGARRIDAQIGLEPTLDAYLETMVAVCRELRRVLKPSGVFFLNIGDCYCAQPPGRTSGDPFKTSGLAGMNTARAARNACQSRPARSFKGLKPKDLMLVPERLGIALQADGWWVRSHIIWAKKNPMPESVTDRPTSSHETIWMLTKSSRYYWDAESVAESHGETHRPNFDGVRGSEIISPGFGPQNQRCGSPNNTRNIRNVWNVASQPFPGAHFATMPPEIAERCIKAGSPRGGQILDPFAGAGTTGLVADRLGRDCTLIDLNTKYAEMAMNRIKDDAPLFAEVAAE